MALFMFRWGLVRRRREPRVTTATPTATRDDAPLPWSRKVKHLLSVFCVVNDGAYRDWHLNICSVVSRSIAAFTMPAALSRMFRVKTQVEQRVVVPARSQDNIAPVSTVAAARTAARDKFFTAKCKAAVPAIAGFYRDCDLIYEQLWKLALGDDVDKLAEPAPVAKLDSSGNGSEQGVIFSQTHVLARFVASAALAHDNRPSRYDLAGEHFYAETLRIRVSAIF